MTIAQLVALGRAETKPAEPKVEKGTLGDLMFFEKLKVV